MFLCACVFQARDRLRLSLGEKAPTLVPVSQVMMCMNCTSDFSLTLRRHHCHGCGRVSPTQIKYCALWWRLFSELLFCTCGDFMLLDTDCLPELLEEQISTEIHEGPYGQSVWPLLQRAKEERCENCFFKTWMLHYINESSVIHRKWKYTTCIIA